MRYDEFKRRAIQFGNTMVDNYFPAEDNVLNKVANNMCKYIMRNKINTLDPYMNMFTKEDGEIDAKDFVEYMQVNMIGDCGLKINLHDHFPMLPDRTLTVTKDDLNCFLN